MSRRKTTLARIYRSDIDFIRSRFPDTKIVDFIHVSIRSNPFIKAESLLRGKNVKARKK
tara:strand:- start:209 stop:385 length:177 start_codon:yes stop_codon:yes gene_type:complete